MADAVRFTLDDGTVVLVAPPARSGTGPVGLGTRLENAGETLRQALTPISAAASEMIDQFRSTARRPDEVEVTFGVTLDAKLGAVLASANGGAHLDVTLRWSGTEPAPVPARGEDAGAPVPDEEHRQGTVPGP
ncbi:CU044_2847 family protein [Streptomyces sp. NPDC047000]|uniref:CU044_2847 family protein n=1 Tax=Streptomyces sp. NPDC047000 TaxID=3155474 RepID=UPI0033D5A90A